MEYISHTYEHYLIGPRYTILISVDGYQLFIHSSIKINTKTEKGASHGFFSSENVDMQFRWKIPDEYRINLRWKK